VIQNKTVMLSIILLICVVVALCVVIHYEFLLQLTRLLPKFQIRPRLRILLGVFVALIAHSVEIWIFAVAYYFMHRSENWGTLEGNFDGSLEASVYYSFTTYTTLGFGDIAPFGELRFLTGVESLTGLVLITWTASFLYMEMSRYWD
jgi:hypothetical protein